MNNLENKTVAALVTENIKTAHIFKKYGIDFCCGGGVSVLKAAQKANINYKDLEKDLFNVQISKDRAIDYNNWSLIFLADHIVNVHHSYVEESIPILLQYADRVVKVHGNHYKKLITIQELLIVIAGELSTHMKKEELILFPFVKKLVKAFTEKTEIPESHFGSVDNPINMMETEHEEAGEILREIAGLSNNYQPPKGACNTYRAFYAKLEEFEQDLHQHVHLENNILFPKTLQLERELMPT